MSLQLSRDGAQLFAALLDAAQLTSILEAVSGLPQHKAGVRLKGIEALNPFLASDGCIGRLAASVLEKECVPVRAILFDKTENSNWSLAWHQDRTIAVEERIDVQGFGPWSIKDGMHHVEPPFDLLASLLTMRIHLDDVPDTNAPLLIAKGSHKLGRIVLEDIPKVVEGSDTYVCTAHAGDVWVYSTPVLHASKSADVPGRRRVLQVDYAAACLPDGLRWAGI